MMESREIAKKPDILAFPGRKKILFQNRASSLFRHIAILQHRAKNQQKLMSQSQEKLVTDERTNGRTTVN